MLGLSSSVTAQSPAPLALSKDTSTKATCKKLAVGGADGWEPISYIDHEGRQSGIGIDILKEYANRHQLDIELNLFIPWTRTLQMLQRGELDVITGAYFTTERRDTYFYSVPFTEDEIVVFQHKNNRFNVSDLQDLIGYRGARPQGGSYGDYIDNFAAMRLDMVFSPTGNRIFDILMNGRVDYVILGRFDGLTNIYRDNRTDQIVLVEPPLEQNAVHLMFSRKSPCMEHVKNINILIQQLIDDGTITQWTQNHLSTLSQGAS